MLRRWSNPTAAEQGPSIFGRCETGPTRFDLSGAGAAARPIDESIEPVLEMPAGDSDAVSGDHPLVPPVTDPKGPGGSRSPAARRCAPGEVPRHQKRPLDRLVVKEAHEAWSGEDCCSHECTTVISLKFGSDRRLHLSEWFSTFATPSSMDWMLRIATGTRLRSSGTGSPRD